MFSTLQSVAKAIGLSLLGLLFYLGTTTYVILSLPLFFYRCVITKIAAPYFRENFGDPICIAGQAFAAELIHPNHDRSPRCTIVVTLTLDRHVGLDEICKIIDTRWIKAEKGKGKLKYPELQQHPVSWMGITFWEQDQYFHLSDHLNTHKIDETGSDQDSQLFFAHLSQKLLNEPWKPKRSPWELHLVHNYKNSSLLGNDIGVSKNLSILIFRMHHAMGDGFALLYLLEQFFGKSLQKPMLHAKKSDLDKPNFLTSLTSCVQMLRTALYEGGRFVTFFTKDSLYHVPDRKKVWSQVFGRAPSIPLSKIKYVKRTFGVGFASVINSAVAAAMGKMLVKLRQRSTKSQNIGIPTHLIIANPAPKPNHPKTLTIHVLGVSVEAPIDQYMDPVKRLHECQQGIEQAGRHPMPNTFGFLVNAYGGHLASFGTFLLKNRFVGTGVSSFLGPDFQLEGDTGWKCVAIDFTAGGMDGVVGIAYMGLSYAGSFQITASAERSIMSEQELDELLRVACEEIDILYGLAQKANQENAIGKLGDENIVSE